MTQPTRRIPDHHIAGRRSTRDCTHHCRRLHQTRTDTNLHWRLRHRRLCGSNPRTQRLPRLMPLPSGIQPTPYHIRRRGHRTTIGPETHKGKHNQPKNNHTVRHSSGYHGANPATPSHQSLSARLVPQWTPPHKVSSTPCQPGSRGHLGTRSQRQWRQRTSGSRGQESGQRQSVPYIPHPQMLTKNPPPQHLSPQTATLGKDEEARHIWPGQITAIQQNSGTRP